MNDPAGVRRDRHGIPHIEAGSVVALAYAQGRVTAHDRAWQLETGRRWAEGLAAELLGPAGVAWDVFARRARIADTGRAAYERLTAPTRELVTAYVDGVNAGFADGATGPELDELGVGPQRWQPWTPLAVFWTHHVLFGSFPSKLWRHHVARTAGEEALALFRAEGLHGGSNAFAVGGGRTASGHPIVAGDPHRLLEDPNVYAQVRLVCTDPDDAFDVAGFAFPGMPGVQHFAHAGDVAWAITNAVADSHDLFTERLQRCRDSVVALGPDGWEPVVRHVEEIPVAGGDPVDVEVLDTMRGPVVIGGPDEGEALSLRTPPYVLADLGFEAVLPLLRARSVADVEAAWARWVDPVNNVVAADRTGRVVHLVAGRVPGISRPVRRLPGRGQDGHGWTGWLRDLPRTEAGPDGAVVTSNQRATPEFGRIGDDFAPPFRADRIRELLDGHDALTPAAAARVLTDVRQTAGAVLLALVDRAGEQPGLAGPAADVRRRLLGWDREMTAASTDATLFVRVRDEVVARICASEALAGLRDPAPYGELFAPWLSLPGRVAGSLHTILAAERPFGLDPLAVVRDALQAVAAKAGPGDEVPWGAVHVFHPLHARAQHGLPGRPAPATPLAGDSECVLATVSVPGVPVCWRGPSARYVWDLADRSAGGWVVPLGASGDPTSPHHRDQHDAWATGRLVPIEPAGPAPGPGDPSPTSSQETA